MPMINELVRKYGRQQYLAMALGFYLLIDALVPESQVLNYAMLTILVFVGPLATGKTNRQRVVTVVLALAMVVLGFNSAYVDTPVLFVLAHVAAVAFFSSLIYLMSYSLLIEQTRVTAETLWGAINVYLLFGMLFAFLYALVEMLIPGAFSGTLLEGRTQLSQTFTYYSFVTMTTLGYGDITPQIQFAATLAYVQALIGQLYVAILIARLVSMYSIEPKE